MFGGLWGLQGLLRLSGLQGLFGGLPGLIGFRVWVLGLKAFGLCGERSEFLIGFKA